MLIALTRSLDPSIADCQLTFMDRDPIDVPRAMEQHEGYRKALGSMGAEVVNLPAGVGQPDCVFVEDNAVVLDEVAILAEMARDSRQAETTLVGQLLATQREIAWIEPPGTLEGGDVFVIGHTIYVGLSTRTNKAGAKQLASYAEPIGYRVRTVAVTGCLHLTTGAMCAAEGIVLANPQWVDANAFVDVEVVAVDPAEPWAANALPMGGATLMCDCFPRTRELLESVGVTTITTDVAELMKAEAGLTCMSLIFEGESEPMLEALEDYAEIQLSFDRKSGRSSVSG
jgi:dimethylargininase